MPEDLKEVEGRHPSNGIQEHTQERERKRERESDALRVVYGMTGEVVHHGVNAKFTVQSPSTYRAIHHGWVPMHFFHLRKAILVDKLFPSSPWPQH